MGMVTMYRCGESVFREIGRSNVLTLITCLQVVINCCHGNNKIFEIFIHRIFYK